MENIILQDATPLKRCPRCPEGQQWHPATEEFFHRNGKKFHTYCRACRVQKKENPPKGGRPRKINGACTKCGETDPAQFYWSPNGYKYSQCKKCYNQRDRSKEGRNKQKTRQIEWKKANPHYGREYNYKMYGITIEQYEVMLQAQNGVCKICGNPPSGSKKSRETFLHVDHCHATGKVRGLLCHRCNRGLGQFLDNPELLRSAVAYLEK